ncbi:asparagine synthetase B family protein [Acidobacteria bacterium ACD]|nr:MAG: asparagine synthetase B family protein [Acidobacteriota bacterium]MCE7959401.1 asparagine synthetase B family protein [Acidobacteria bacterium ACB2]MDL1949565.1 asparagine synthetase B family protein [Acidobacteria bacterium ACD]
MHPDRPLHEVVDLLDPESNLLHGTTLGGARAAVASGDPASVAAIRGDFALVARDGNRVRMARSLSRPLRYFLAKGPGGPVLIVAERIDEIRRELSRRGWGVQFHPSYTRMVPAHHVLTVDLVGCPDPSPTLARFLAPERASLPADPEKLGTLYVERTAAEIDAWLDAVDPREPIGVSFSGGVDSGAVLLLLDFLLRRRGEPGTRLKAFTLSVEGGGEDLAQARAFLEATGLGYYHEALEVPRSAVSVDEAVRVVEDYKPLDVQAAAMNLALCRAIRARYPLWRHLADGEGGDENFKDYPLETGGEVTIRSVLSNSLLYHEGWGVSALKHSQTYSGGLSRAITRTHAPAASVGLRAFSPFTRPAVVAAAEAIPFVELTAWDEERLYRLKGDLVSRGVRAVTGREMPVFPKRRFQEGAASEEDFRSLFPAEEHAYREAFAKVFTGAFA